MNTKLTLTLEKSTIEKAKRYAHQSGRSLSDLVESYLEKVVSSNALEEVPHEFKDYENGVQHFCALRNETIEAIITRNKKDFKHSQLPVFAPEEVIDLG